MLRATGHARMVRWLGKGLPNQVLTHGARAAAKQLNFSATSGGRAHGAREGLWLEQVIAYYY